MAPSKSSLRLRRMMRRLRCYVGGYTSYMLPRAFFRRDVMKAVRRFAPEEQADIMSRADYYCRVYPPVDLPESESISLGEYRFPYGKKKKLTTYFFDLFSIIKHFPPHLRMRYLFGDVTDEQPVPTFVKSRPVHRDGTTSNSVVLKLNAARHYFLVKDETPFREKRDMLVSRNVVQQPHRKRFVDMWQSHPLCDIGQTNADCDPGCEYRKRPYMPIPEQLKYKFIACIEGNDVATNLKWVMASNSVAVMPRPTYETWFMEGKLIGGIHYIEIKPDFSDLIEKLEYYIARPEEAEAIVRNANAYVRQFMNQDKEHAIGMLTAMKYFKLTNQL